MGASSFSPEHCRETALLLLLLCWLYSTEAVAFSRIGALPGARHSSELLVAVAKYFIRWTCGAGVSLKLLWPLEHSPKNNWCVTNGESPQRAAWSIAGRGSCSVMSWTGSYSAPGDLLAVDGLEQHVSHVKQLQYLGILTLLMLIPICTVQIIQSSFPQASLRMVLPLQFGKEGRRKHWHGWINTWKER